MTEYRPTVVGMTAYRSPTDPLPPLPRFTWNDHGRAEWERLAETFRVDDATMREIVRRGEQVQLWGFPYVERLIGIAQRHGVSFPVSGDDRPDVRERRTR